MKKFYILAAVALVASAACTKVEPVETVTSEPAISFQVANYAGQTKAGETSLKDEGFEEFKTWAWYTSSTADNQEFMTPATVEWNDTAKEWAPTDRAYYWPKTGYVNFFSFAGKHLPDAVGLNGSAQAEAHYTTAITVAPDDNILVADGAYGFFNNNGAIYKKDGVTQGVPTLFRHMLSRVKFDVKVDATGSVDNKDHWKVTVNSATLSYRNQGKLEVVFPSTPSITLGTDGKPTAAGQTQKYTTATWTPESAANATLKKVTTAVVVEADGTQASAAEELIADSVVMPQTIETTNVTIALNYKIEYTYNGGNATSETVPVAATVLTTFSPSITEWAPNTIYTYHITIIPTENRILFDPAVEAWAEVNTPNLNIN